MKERGIDVSDFLPINRQEMEERGWQQPDFVYICGDGYVDHPSFGAAIICRTLESHGFKVCFLAQPDWHNVEEFRQFGKPRLGFLISSGNIDSMVNHYTVAKKRRHKDLYTPGGEGFKRPDRAVIVYSQMARQAYKDANIIIGGIEASLRRLGHYDYWDDKVRKSIIIDANADLLLYGMGENSIIEVAEALDSGLEIKYLTYLDGTVFKTKNLEDAYEPIILPSYEEICKDKVAYAKSFQIQYLNTDHYNAKTLVEPYQGWYVVQNRPNRPLTQREFDRAYSLDYNRTYHPSSEHIPAINEVKFSLISNRGCFGSCNFCALAFHQGRIVQTRSHESILSEASKMVWDPEFKGYIHDVGGPTANFRQPACKKQQKHGACPTKQCLWPKPCNNLEVSHQDYKELLNSLISNGTNYYKYEDMINDELTPNEFYLGKDCSLKILDSKMYDFSSSDTNDYSIPCLLQHGKIRYLLTGDCETKAEANLAKLNIGTVDLFKAGHHGSPTSNTEVFLDSINPKNVVICSSYENSYNLPKKNVIDLFVEKYTQNVYGTFINGNIHAVSNKEELNIWCEGYKDYYNNNGNIDEKTKTLIPIQDSYWYENVGVYA